MQYMSEWVTPDRKRLVVLSAPVLHVFAKYRQRYFWQTESGGILLGKRRGKHLEVVVATEPMPTDRGSQYFFEREAEGHAEAAQLAWRAGDEMVDYVGEWHTHPQRVPIPSGIDRSEWQRLSAGRSEVTALVTVVVGTRQLHLELLNASGHTLLEPLSPSPLNSTLRRRLWVSKRLKEPIREIHSRRRHSS